MKISVLTFIFLLFSFVSLKGQDYHFGIRTGYIQSTIDTENEGTTAINSRHAFQIGFVHTYKPLRGSVGFSIETSYALKGARIDDADLDYRLHYLSVPILLDFYPTKRLKVSAGPEFNYLLDGRNHVNDSTSFTLQDISANRWDIAGALSLSYALDFFADIGVRYSVGLTNLADSDAILNRRRLRNSSFQIFFNFKIAN